jgi:cell fate regulator YaaT (PSP1 superfamily)
MTRIVPIKFRDAGKQYDFNAQQWELRAGDKVVVETDRGRALGIVVTSPQERPATQVGTELKNVLRPAGDEDLAMAAANGAREETAFRFCQQRVVERGMEMKMVRAEYLFDGSKIIFYFTADSRVDFRELVKDLAHHFHTRIEMRQIGVRDEAKLTGGIGICGRELCCCTFLTEFAPVSVKMAKEQGLALNPTKISGQCGRLLCCLAYEFETYCSMRKGLPKCGRKICLDGAEGEVTDVNVLGQKVTVRLPDGKRVEVSAEEVAAGERLQPPASGSPSATPQDRSAASKFQRQRPPRRPGEPRPPAPRPVPDQPAAPGATVSPPEVPAESSADVPELKPLAKKGRRRNRRRPKRKE